MRVETAGPAAEAVRVDLLILVHDQPTDSGERKKPQVPPRPRRSTQGLKLSTSRGQVQKYFILRLPARQVSRRLR